MIMSSRLTNWARSLIYPGLDLHTRNRALLSRYWKTGLRDVLDAGSGNGYFAWRAYQSGARVVAINIDKEEIDKARRFLNGWKRVNPTEVQFEQRNLYDLATETRSFDEIICYETLEHVGRDSEVIREFSRILRRGGFLHLCCPFSPHPRHQAEVLDEEERGGHVRAGYTEQDYRGILTPIGFKIDRVVGIGGPGLYRADAVLRAIRNRLGDLAALPLLPLALPFVWFARENPHVPFSIYVRAVKE
jgi:SAM-dependent methyltransferase